MTTSYMQDVKFPDQGKDYTEVNKCKTRLNVLSLQPTSMVTVQYGTLHNSVSIIAIVHYTCMAQLSSIRK